MDGRIKSEYLDRIKSTDQANKTQATRCIRYTFDRYMSINKHLLASQFWNKMEAKQHVSDCQILLELMEYLDSKRKQQLSRLVCVSIEYCLTNHCKIYDFDNYLLKVIRRFINMEKDMSVMFCIFCMLDYCHNDIQDTYYLNIVRAGLSGTLLEYYIDLLGTVTNQNKESVLDVIRNLKAAGAQRVDLEEALKLVDSKLIS